MVAGVAMACAASAYAPSARALSPWRSARELPISNGRAAASIDGATGKIIRFLDHPYLAASASERTRNLRFDTYAGVRVGTSSVWLNAVVPSFVGYDDGRGMVRVERRFEGLKIVEQHFAPMGLSMRALVSVITVTRETAGGAVSVAALINDHVGSGTAGTSGETIARTAHGVVESGPSGYRLLQRPLGLATAMAAASASMDNPYQAFSRGDSLANTVPSAPAEDVVVGLQASLGNLAVGASASFGWVTALADEGVSTGAADDLVTQYISGRDAATLAAFEATSWDAWLTAPAFAASASERANYRLQQAMLRMAQVRENGRGFGQIMASLDLGLGEGNWNVAWVRDMAYATVALAQTGHLAEAKDALAFVLNADSGKYVRDGQGRAYVGVPYQVSVCRYYGLGVEETDDDGTGPNIEFDGFGLYLWSLGRYLAAGGDEAFVRASFGAIRDKIVAPLVSLQEASGLVAADSSIWERHWNGNQKRFAYTSITGARGLCEAATLAERLGENASATPWRAAGKKMQNALISQLRDDRGFLAQSLEDLQAGRGYVDAAVIEAITLGLVHPQKRTARATVQGLEAALGTATRMGIFRNDDGSAYDRAEWVFLDLRLATAHRFLGNTARANGLEEWVRGQNDENFGLVAELFDERTGAYRGSVPMAGFGAGAWLLERVNRQSEGPGCGTYAEGDEEATGADAADAGGVPAWADAGAGATDGGPTADAGFEGDGAAGSLGDGAISATPLPEFRNENGCGCAVVGRHASGPSPWSLGAAWVMALAVLARRRSERGPS